MGLSRISSPKRQDTIENRIDSASFCAVYRRTQDLRVRDLESCDILPENLVIWTDVTHPLTVGVEMLNTAHHITFTDIRIESFSPPFANGGIDLIQLEIKPNTWSKTKLPGYIRNITLLETPFKPSIEMRGFDEGHTIENVTIENVVVKGP